MQQKKILGSLIDADAKAPDVTFAALIFVKLMKMNEKLKIIFPRKPQIEPKGEIFVRVFRTGDCGTAFES